VEYKEEIKIILGWLYLVNLNDALRNKSKTNEQIYGILGKS